MDDSARNKTLIWKIAVIFLLALPNVVYLFQNPDKKAFTALLLSLMLLTGIVRVTYDRPWILALVSLLLGLISYVDIIHLLDYGAHLSVGGIGAIFDTDPKEASEFFLAVSPTTLPLLSIFAVATALLVWRYPGRQQHPTSRKQQFATLLLILLPIIDFSGKGSSWHSAPMTTIKAMFDYRAESARIEELLAQHEGHHFDATRRMSSPGPEHYVLILGESVRRDHLEQYGYERKTSPRLAARDDILIFTNVVSPANQTRRAVKIMLSPATALDLSDYYRKGTLIGLAKEAGFHTAWLSNQGRYGEHDTEVSSIGREADVSVFTNTDWITHSLDGQLIAPFQHTTRNIDHDQLTVVHLQGSHGSYFKRYPPDFDIFHDLPPKLPATDQDLANAVNAYDNSLRYTDHVVAELIEALDTANAPGCAIYTPDHGEVLGEENRRTTHGFPTVKRAEAEIPFFIWCSKSFRQAHTATWARLQANRYLPFSTEHLFDLLADLMSIQYRGENPRTSIANAAFTPPKTRFLLGTNGKPTSYESFAAAGTDR